MKIFIEKSALDYQLSKKIISQFSDWEIISSYEDFSWDLLSTEELISLGKRYLFLMEYRGKFVRPCPGTQNYYCCSYQIFHIGEGCPLDCAYCILQLYLNRPGLKVWGNLLERGLEELRVFLNFKKEKGEVVRIGTGEFTDSLALEPITHISEILIDFWSTLNPLGVLELKTKVVPSSFFASIKGDPRIILSWSVNTDWVIAKEEKGTAPLLVRLQGALQAIQKGFTVAFHFDPIIYYPLAEEDYPKVLELILNTIPLDKIAWISLGTLRFPKDLKYIAEKRFPHTRIYSYEFIEGLDQKKRYFIEVRKRLYKSLEKLIKATWDQVCYYFCMEGDRVWEEVLGMEGELLPQKLDRVALKLCS